MDELFHQNLTREQHAERRTVPYGKHKYRSLGWIARNDLLYLDFLHETVWLADLRADLEIVRGVHADALARARHAAEMVR